MNLNFIMHQLADWRVPFGKYKGEKILDVYKKDPGHIKMIHRNLDDDDKNKAAIKLLCIGEDDE